MVEHPVLLGLVQTSLQPVLLVLRIGPALVLGQMLQRLAHLGVSLVLVYSVQTMGPLEHQVVKTVSVSIVSTDFVGLVSLDPVL